MTFIEMFLSDTDAFDENEARDLAFHCREEQRRHHRAERKLTFLIWMVTLFFACFLINAPEAAKLLVGAVLR
jgi:hypothetical protein